MPYPHFHMERYCIIPIIYTQKILFKFKNGDNFKHNILNFVFLSFFKQTFFKGVQRFLLADMSLVCWMMKTNSAMFQYKDRMGWMDTWLGRMCGMDGWGGWLSVWV